MATISLNAELINQMPELIGNVSTAIAGYKDELFSLKTAALNIDSRVCSVDDVIGMIQSSTSLQDDRITALDNLQTHSEEFVANAIRIDKAAADEITQSKEAFYDEYYYLKPDCEKNVWEKIGDAINSAADWCREHWKLFATIAIVIVLIAASAVVPGAFAVILSGALKGAIAGIITGALTGGLQAYKNGHSFMDFIEGSIDGAFSGVLMGALMGGAFAGIGQLGVLVGKGFQCTQPVCDFIHGLANVTGNIGKGMMFFDRAALADDYLATFLGEGFGIADLNKMLHSNSVYNAFSLGVGITGAFSAGMASQVTCFVAGTLVLTVNGLVAIESIKSADKVISTDPETGYTTEKTVLDTIHRTATEFVHLTVNNEVITVTPEHPFYVLGKGFVKAGKLDTDDVLLDVQNNRLAIRNIAFESTEEPTDVYNIIVEDNHTYYVGDSYIFVHNADCLPAKKYLVSEDPRIYEREVNGEKIRIQFKEGPDGKLYPDFSEHTHPEFKDPMRPKTFELNGNNGRDTSKMTDELIKTGVIHDKSEIEGYVWHHCEDGESLILVNSSVHGAFYHQGGAAIIRGETATMNAYSDRIDAFIQDRDASLLNVYRWVQSYGNAQNSIFELFTWAIPANR